MPNDQVIIDPEFRLSPPRVGQSRWLRFGAVAAAAFMLGWLLLSTTPGQINASEAEPSTTAPTREPTTVSEMVGLTMPLGEAVPGFADTITMTVSHGPWGESVDVVRWRSSQEAPAMIVSFSPDFGDEWGGFAGLDAAGTSYAVHEGSGVLSVLPVAAIADDEGWWEPTREVVGLRVVDAAWHDTEPGRLAWVSCPRMPGGPGILYTLNVANRSAEPVAETELPDACGDLGAWINQWGKWGFALGQEVARVGEDDWDEGNTRTVLLGPGGAELAQFEDSPGGPDMVAAGPAGTIWNEEAIGGASSSFLLSLDGQRRVAVPGLTEGEWVDQAMWSADGSRIALVAFSTSSARPSIRVVDATTGETVSEVDEPDSVVGHPCWSSEGRFLLYGRADSGGGLGEAELVVYDTATATIAAAFPLLQHHDLWEIRTTDLAATTLPSEWHIDAADDWAPGVHTVHMIVEVAATAHDAIEDPSGTLIWDEAVVDLCGIAIRGVGGGVVRIGDIFQTIEGCGSNPTAMQDAFDAFGLPEEACLRFSLDDLNHEYCAPLS